MSGCNWIAAVTTLAAITAIVCPARGDDTLTRAMYCSSVIKTEYNTLLASTDAILPAAPTPQARQEMIAANEKVREHFASQWNRLRAYVLTNWNLSNEQEGLAFTFATKQGETDATNCSHEISDNSTYQCAYQRHSCANADFVCLRQTMLTCGAPSCAATIRCSDLSWLPY